jgi:hypothetical protein
LRVFDTELAEHALETVDLARRDRDERNAVTRRAFTLPRRQACLRVRERIRGALRQRRNADHAAPSTELNDERERRLRGNVVERERSVSPSACADERLSACGCVALITGTTRNTIGVRRDAVRECLRLVRDVNERVRQRQRAVRRVDLAGDLRASLGRRARVVLELVLAVVHAAGAAIHSRATFVGTRATADLTGHCACAGSTAVQDAAASVSNEATRCTLRGAGCLRARRRTTHARHAAAAAGLSERRTGIAALKEPATSIRDRPTLAGVANRASETDAAIRQKRNASIGDLTAATLARSSTSANLWRRTLLAVERSTASVTRGTAFDSKLRACPRNASGRATTDAQCAAATTRLLSGARSAALDEATTSIAGRSAINLEVGTRLLRASARGETAASITTTRNKAGRDRPTSIFAVAAVVERTSIF